MHCESLETRRLFSAGPVAHALPGGLSPADAFTTDFGFVNGRHRAAFVSAPDGTQFVFTISGNGTGTATADGAGFRVALAGTDARSSLNVFTDNIGLVTGLTVDGSLRGITARGCTVGGDVGISGTLGFAALFGLSSEAGNTIHFDIGGAGVPTDLGVALVSDVTLTTNSPIRGLRVGRWADLNAEPDVITAPSIGLLKSFGGRGYTGSFEADLNLTAPGVTSLARMDVAGGLNGAAVRAAGSIGKVTVGAMHDSLLLAGVRSGLATLPAAASDFVTPASIASITVRGTAPAAFSDSVIAASSVGRVVVGRVGSQNATPAPFGVAATSVGYYKRLTTGRPVLAKAVSTLGPFDSEGSYAAQIVG